MRDKIMKAELVRDRVIEARLAYEEKRIAILAGLADNILFEYDREADTIYFTKPIRLQNQMVKSLRECSKKKTLVPYVHPEDISQVNQLITKGENGSIEFRCLTKEGYLWFRITLIQAACEEEKLTKCFGSLTNIHNEKCSLIYQEYAQNTDHLTRLYNLGYMQQSISKYLKKDGASGTHALLIMDMVQFSYINETYGSMFGDTILIQAANKLKDIFYPSELIGRVGSDQYMIFVKNMKKREDLFLKIDQVCQQLSDIYTGEMKDCIKAIFGVAMYPNDGKTFEDLFRHADTACYVAKNKGYGNLMLYENCILHLKEEEEFYSQYEVRGDHTFGSSNFDKEITTFTMDVMQKMKDVNHGVIVLMNHLVNVLNVDSVRIYEVSDDHNSLNMSYTSGSRRMIQEKRQIIYEEPGLVEYESLFEHGFFKANNTADIQLLPLKRSFYERGIHSTLQCALYEAGVFRGCIAIEDMNRKRVWTEYEYSALYTIATIFTTYLLKLRDYEDMKDQLKELKNYDQLTKLANINKFKKEAESILHSDSGTSRYAIVAMDFLQFKYVNDTCGFEVGDQVLYEYARALELMEWNLSIARETSDRFLLLVKVNELSEAKQWITEMNEEFARSQEKRLLGWKLSIVAGICEVRSANGINEALDKAQLARKSIHDVHKTDSCIYDDEMHEKVRRELEIIRSQERALNQQEFEVYLQPKIGLEDNQLVGAEALIRWNRKDGTMMYPDEFIPVFEKNGFILRIDFFVYETVCKLLHKWKVENKKAIPISVNVSRLHLTNDNFAKEFVELVQKYEVPTNLLELELTESMVLENVQSAISTMQGLQEKGFLVSIDDFGAGYSSLNLLKDLKTDILKLDREFFRQGDLRKQDKIIVSNIINMAKQLDMKVLSEGVETTNQSEFLREISCDMAQGYLFAKPMPIADFERFLCEYSIGH